MEATSKLRPPLPSADRPLLRVRGRFLSDNADNEYANQFNITCILRYFQKCAKLRTFVSERVNQFIDFRANSKIFNQMGTESHTHIQNQ